MKKIYNEKMFTFVFLLSLLVSPLAHAELGGTTATGANGSTTSTTPYSTEQPYCDSVCPYLSNSSGELLNLAGTGAWSTSDDQWCANHGSQTNPSVTASPVPLNATIPAGSCAITYYPGDTSCAQVTSYYDHCQFQNSQVESYCQAYEAAKVAGSSEKLVLDLDIAGTATCAAECVATSVLTGAGAIACKAASTAASAADMIASLTAQSSAIGKSIGVALGAAGVAEGAAGLLGHSLTNNSSWNVALENKCAGNPSCAGDTLDQQETNHQNKRNACITAVTLAALSGLRYYNMGYGLRTKESACGNVYSLQSSASAIAGGVAAGGIPSPSASGGSSGGTTTTGSTGNLGSSGSSTSSSPTGSQLNCIAQGGTLESCTDGQVSAATAGGILNSGLAQAAAPLAQQLSQAGLAQGLNSGIGSAMSSALGSSGDFGQALAKVADTAFNDGKLLASAAPLTSAGSGMARTPSATKADFGAFNLDAAGASAPASQEFKSDPSDSTDIWHSHTDQNLFQIVSGRIVKDIPRLGSVP